MHLMQLLSSVKYRKNYAVSNVLLSIAYTLILSRYDQNTCVCVGGGGEEGDVIIKI